MTDRPDAPTEEASRAAARLSRPRRLLKRFHPEAIPWPASVLYNWLSSASVFQRHYELVARDISSYCAQGRLLDIGTGPGWLLLKLRQQCPVMRLTGLDASSAMVVEAQKNMADAGLSDVIEITQGNASHMPFADACFDIVVSTGSIHHWKHPTGGLNDVYRVLKPAGYALMYDLVSDTPAPVLNEMAREHGRFRTWLLWLHSFEEPFHTCEGFEQLARSTLFRQGQTKFVGVLCCLILRKGGAGEQARGRYLKLDEQAASASPGLPAFLARPEGAPVYHGFPIIRETLTDGWCFGAITEYADAAGCDSGDGFVVAPDGSRAGLVWDVGQGEIAQISPPDAGRWGVYQVWFPKPIRTTDDLVQYFRAVLPQLQRIHATIRNHTG